MFQISVQDLADQTGDWTLSIYNQNGTSQDVEITHMNSGVGLYLMEDEVGIKSKTSEAATGVKIDGDVAFSFILDGTNSNADYFNFELTNGTKTFVMELTATDGLLQGGKAYLMPNINSTNWE